MNTQKAIFGGGCFWCTEAVYKQLKGVVSVNPGYAGGDVESPKYEEVSGGGTGHAEVIQVEYVLEQISYQNLLTVFFAMHDPTTLNQQGADMGTQYRSIIFYVDSAQRVEAQKFIDDLTHHHVFEKPIVTEIKPFKVFYPAEQYHLDYYARNSSQPYCQVVINPKLKKLKEKFATLLK